MIGVESRIRDEIAEKIYQFYALVDQGAASRTAEMFASGARLTFGPGSPQPGTLRGEEIRAAMQARERLSSAFTRHAVTNIMLRPESDGRISARYLLILFRSDDPSRSSLPAFVADVSETWTRAADHWQIAEREIIPQFARA